MKPNVQIHMQYRLYISIQTHLSLVVTSILQGLFIFGLLRPSPSAMHRGAYGAVVTRISDASTFSTVDSEVFIRYVSSSVGFRGKTVEFFSRRLATRWIREANTSPLFCSFNAFSADRDIVFREASAPSRDDFCSFKD